MVDLRLFQFTLLEIGSWVHADQTTGRLVHVPNGRIFTDPVANYTKGFSHIWEEFPVLVTFESDWARAEVLLQELAIRHGAAAAHVASPQMAEAAREFLLSPGGTSPEPRVYLTVVDSGVLLTVRMVCDPRHRRDLGSAFWRDVLTSFAEAGGIELAYPTTRFYAGADRATKS